MKKMVYLDGRVLDGSQATVSIFDRGFLFGDGVYETGRSYDRCILYWEEHVARLRRSAGRLAIPVQWADDEIKKALYEVVRIFGEPNVYFRIIITRGVVEAVGLDELDVSKPTLAIIVQELKSHTQVQWMGVKLLTSKIRRNSALAQDPNIKTSNYLNSLLAFQDVRGRGGEDAIMCDTKEHVTEGTTFSVFGVTDTNILITPSLDVGILDGITRRHVIQNAKGFLKVEEAFFKLAVFHECREVFIASSIREIVPVREWDGRQYPVPGKITRDIHARLKEDIQGYVATHEKV